VGYAEWDDEFLDMRMLFVEGWYALRGHIVTFFLFISGLLNQDVV
jgi:hypothetical protein